jgi:hypothetical protein
MVNKIVKQLGETPPIEQRAQPLIQVLIYPWIIELCHKCMRNTKARNVVLAKSERHVSKPKWD